MGRGSVERRGNKYRIVYHVEGVRRQEGGFTSRLAAEEQLRKILGDVAAGTYREQRPITFAEFADVWIRDYATVRLKPASLEAYTSHLSAHLRPAFGHLEVRRISHPMVQGFIAEKAKALSAKSVRNIFILLRRMFHHAVRWGYIRHNPAVGTDKPRLEPTERDYLTPAEARAMLRKVDPRYRTLILTAVMTGLRISELLALQWGDIQGDVLFVRRSLYWASRGEEDEARWTLQSPKSIHARREVDLAPSVVAALEAHRRARKVIVTDAPDWVFPSRSGGPLEQKNVVRRVFYPALRKAGLRRIRFHDLRHTYAAMQVASGAGPKYLQRQMGHASIQTTLDTYGHLYPDRGKEAAARLDDTLGLGIIGDTGVAKGGKRQQNKATKLLKTKNDA